VLGLHSLTGPPRTSLAHRSVPGRTAISAPAWPFRVDRLQAFPGRLAQLGERRLDKAEVTGSSPVSPTCRNPRFAGVSRSSRVSWTRYGPVLWSYTRRRPGHAVHLDVLRTTTKDTRMSHDRHIDVFPDRAGRARWHEVAGNNKRTATSGQSFASLANALRAARAQADGREVPIVVRQAEHPLLAAGRRYRAGIRTLHPESPLAAAARKLRAGLK
jgi:hypothetical protein